MSYAYVSKICVSNNKCDYARMQELYTHFSFWDGTVLFPLVFSIERAGRNSTLSLNSLSD